MMKRFFIILFIICLLIPFFSINSSAATYDLGTPSLWYSPYGRDDPYPTFLPDEPLGTKFFLLYYDQYKTDLGFQDHFNWSLKYGFDTDIKSVYDLISYKLRSDYLDYSKPAIAFGIQNSSFSLNNTLIIPGLEYESLYWPSEEQVIKIDFSVDTYALGTSQGIPDTYYDYLDPYDLCFFTCTAGENNTANLTLLSMAVHFDTVVISPSLDSRRINFTYYFNGYGSAFTDLKNYVDNHYSGSTLSLVVRFPYYLGSNSRVTNGAYIVSAANLPVSYELMTPGDYSQELDAIENAIITSNEKLYDMYTEMSEEDIAFIVHSKAQNEKLDSTIKDYDNAQSGINNIIDNVTLPPVNIDDANSTFDDIGLGNISENEGLWSISIVTMVIITFTFATLSLLLFGKKG